MIIIFIILSVLLIIGSIFYFKEYHANMFHSIMIIIGCMILVAMIISIEVFLLYLCDKKYKLITIGYYLGEAILLLILNSIIPFYSVMIILCLNMFKNVYRIQKLETIYDKEILYELCDWFNIKIKKTRKKRTATVTKKKNTVKTTAKKAPAKRTAKKASKSYA